LARPNYRCDGGVIFSHGTYGAWGGLLAKARFGKDLQVVAAAPKENQKEMEEETLFKAADIKNWQFLPEE